MSLHFSLITYEQMSGMVKPWTWNYSPYHRSNFTFILKPARCQIRNKETYHNKSIYNKWFWRQNMMDRWTQASYCEFTSWTDSKKCIHFYGTPVSSLCWQKHTTKPYPVQCTLCASFLQWGIISSTSSPKLEGHPLTTVRDCLFNTPDPTLHTWRLSPSPTTWGQAMPWWQGTHLTFIKCKLNYSITTVNGKRLALIVSSLVLQIRC
jgi:hypothetical protein